MVATLSRIMAIAVSSEELNRIIFDERKAALVLFSGNWCPDCADFKPTWLAWSKNKEGPIYILEVPRGGAEWDDWSIDEIPTVASYSRGEERGRVHGTISARDLDELWKKL